MSNRDRLIALHVSFWLGYFILFTGFFSNFYSLEYALYRTSWNAVMFMILAYTNIFWLIPKYLEKKKFGHYAVLMIIFLIALTLVRTSFHDSEKIISILRLPDPGRMRRRARGAVFFSFFAVFVFSTSYRLAQGWFQNLTVQARLKSQQLEAELKFLRTQINPHFLFNTLNNIYTLCLLKEDNAAPMVMKLSALMRYMLYECREDKVSLAKEVDFLNDFIDLQKLKTERPQNIQFITQGIGQEYQIIPLLLLPLLENSFKHGDVDTDPKGWVKVTLEVGPDRVLSFSVTNTVGQLPKQKVKASGIGLENTRRRLSLMYPDRHTLVVSTQEGLFSIDLSIQLD